MAAHGSGAVRRSLTGRTVMNVDIGGGTSKIAVCVQGRVITQTALDVGARLASFDGEGRLVRLEEAGKRFVAGLGLPAGLGAPLSSRDAALLVSAMADALFEAMRGGSPQAGGAALLRLDPLSGFGRIEELSFSGGVAEYVYGRESAAHGDLGPLLAQAVRDRAMAWGPRLIEPAEAIRATVIGVSQYAVQLSGGTIFVSPLDILPLRNVPVIAPDLGLDSETIGAERIADATRGALQRLDLGGGEQPVAVFAPWRGSATYQRLDDFCRGIAEGLEGILSRGHALILVGDGDVGGLIGLHCRDALKLKNPIVSIDGISLREFDYIDIGRIIATSGAVPVVIKSLIFPGDAATRKG
jgi:ethanolamine utilization protein EutA